MYKDNPAIDVIRDAKNVKRNKHHHKVLQAMIWSEEGYYITFAQIADGAELEVARTRKIVRHLKRKGLVEHHCGLFCEDGMICGSGHGLTQRGRTILAIIAEGDK